MCKSQCVKLLETCDRNVDIAYKTILWNQKPHYKIKNYCQYDKTLTVDLESKIKAKKWVAEKEDLVLGISSSIEDSDEEKEEKMKEY